MSRLTTAATRKLRQSARNPEWAQLWPEICPTLVTAPRVVAIGDLHVENFEVGATPKAASCGGQRRGRSRCAAVPQDLVRLAASAVLAIKAEHFLLSARDACAAIVEGYCAALRRGGTPVVLLPKRRDEAKLLRAMGWETANVHLGSAPRRMTAHALDRRGRWLRRAASDMGDAIVEE